MLGVVSLGVAGIDLWQREFVINRFSNDLERVIGASEWLARIGRDNPAVHTHVAGLLVLSNQPDAAVAEYRRSIEFHPTPATWVGLGRLQADRGLWSEASESFAGALAEDPDYVDALVDSGRVWLQLGRPDRARKSLERARSLAPMNAEIREWLRQAIAAEIDRS